MATGEIEYPSTLKGKNSITGTAPDNTVTVSKPTSTAVLILVRGTSNKAAMYAFDWWGGMMPLVSDSNISVTNNGNSTVTIKNLTAGAIEYFWIY